MLAPLLLILLNMFAVGMVIVEVMCMGPTKTGKTRMVRHTHKLNNVCTSRMITVHNVTGTVEVK